VEPVLARASTLVPQGGRVAVFRPLPGLGDLLCVVPALRALRTARPDVEVTYIGLPAVEPLVARYPQYIDRFMAFPGFPGLPGRRPDLQAIPRFIRDGQAARFDLAIQLHGPGTISNSIVGLLGAQHVAGHTPAGAAAPERHTFLPWVEPCSEIRRSLRLMTHLGWPSDDEAMEFDIAPGTVAPPIGEPYVVVHPGASTAAHRWSASGFHEVAERLGRDGIRIVLTGSASERSRNEEVGAGLSRPALDLAGSTTLDELALTLRGARLVVANDGGVARLAVALDVPSVIVFTGSDPARWSPFDPSRHRGAPGSARRVVAEARRLLARSRLRNAA
jgi:ADP-heptose:LPS heptosyltransferase